MTYLKKHLLRAGIVEGILFSLFFLNACNESSRPDKYIARVNNSYLTEEELAGITDTGKASRSDIKEAIRNWVQRELLYQQAEREGIVDQDEYEKIMENSGKQLAGALLLKKVSIETEYKITPGELEAYYNKNRNSFSLPSNSYLLNIAKFNDYFRAVQFRSELISGGWNSAIKYFEKDTSLIEVVSGELLSEYEIYPKEILRVVQGLYPLEISIVISDMSGYYSVLEVLDRFEKGGIPPFNIIKPEVEKRFKAELEKLAIEKYINELYKKSKIEINYK